MIPNQDMGKFMYIYLITNLKNNKKYVGQTVDFVRRMRQHQTQDQQLIDKKIQQYGVKNFSFQILEDNLTQDEANEKEKYYIQYFNTLIPNGYNIHSGELNGRAKLTKDDVIKIRELHKTLSNSEIYKLYPQVSPTSIRNVINGKT